WPAENRARVTVDAWQRKGQRPARLVKLSSPARRTAISLALLIPTSPPVPSARRTPSSNVADRGFVVDSGYPSTPNQPHNPNQPRNFGDIIHERDKTVT